MSGKDSEKITIRPGPSRRLAAMLLITHGGAAALLPVLPIPAVAAWMLFLLIAFSLVYYWRLELLRLGPRAVRMVEWSGEGEWMLTDHKGSTTWAELDASSYLHPGLIILNFTLPNKDGRRHLILFRDGIDPALFRKLSVRLHLTARNQ